MIDLAIPQFLQRTGSAKIPRSIRWKKMKPAQRPEGERWISAARWEVFIGEEVPKLAVGLRIVWAVEGRKWARLHDGHLQAKVGMREWLRLKAAGRRVES